MGRATPAGISAAREIAFTRSVSEDLSAIAYGMDWSPGDAETEATLSTISTLANENRRR